MKPDEYEGCKTILELYKKGLKRHGRNNFLGTRSKVKEGNPYEWKTFEQVDMLVEAFARGRFIISYIH